MHRYSGRHCINFGMNQNRSSLIRSRCIRMCVCVCVFVNVDGVLSMSI